MRDGEREAELQPLIEDAIAEQPWEGAGYSLARTFSRNLLPLYGWFLLFGLWFAGYLYLGLSALGMAFLIQRIYITPKRYLLDIVVSPPPNNALHNPSIPLYRGIFSKVRFTPHFIALGILVTASIIPAYAPELISLCLAITICTALLILGRSIAAAIEGLFPYAPIDDRIIFLTETKQTALHNYTFNAGELILILSDLIPQPFGYIRIFLYHVIVLVGCFVISSFAFLHARIPYDGAFSTLMLVGFFWFLPPTPFVIIASLRNYQLDCVAMRVAEKRDRRQQ